MPMPRGELARLRVGQADERIDEDLDDLLGRVVRDFLDVHAAFAGAPSARPSAWRGR